MTRSAGYSGKPLAVKLGLKEGFRISVVGLPSKGLLGGFPTGTRVLSPRSTELDLLLLFVGSLRQLRSTFPRAKARITTDGMLWVSWPKKASGVPTDLTEDIVREVGLAHGLVDVKVAAIDATWSGLKFVYRLKDRS